MTGAPAGPSLEERYVAAARACPATAVGHRRVSPAESLRALADAADELGIDGWDVYGERGAVAAVETATARELATEAAVFFPSGTMAQQAALRVWCERRGSRRVAIPSLAHQLHHEADGPRVLQGFRFELLTDGPRPATAGDLTAVPAAAQLAAVQLELPLREAGCLLPTWDELVAVSEAARSLGVPLHVDGARLWESQPWFGRPLPEITALLDSVYVSFYKGLGGLSGAAVAGGADLAVELRVWRHRMGGRLFRLTPYALSALVGLRDELPQLPAVLQWARSLAAALVERGLRVVPEPPHTPTFRVVAEAPEGGADTVTERLIAVIGREGVRPSDTWRPVDGVPGVIGTEVAVQSAALEHDPVRIADLYAELVAR